MNANRELEFSASSLNAAIAGRPKTTSEPLSSVSLKRPPSPRWPEMATEVPPGIGNTGRMGLYVHNTCIEFKKDILRAGAIAPDYVAQLDGYLKQPVRAGAGVQNGILTDGVNYLIRRPGDDALPDQQGAPAPGILARRHLSRR